MVSLPFGKHKNQPLPEVPTNYLCWLTREAKLSAGLRAAVGDELAGRGVTPPAPPEPPADRPRPCCRCGCLEARLSWQTFRNGARQIRRTCVRCDGLLGFAAQTPANVAQADRNSSPAPLLELLTGLEEAGVEARKVGGVVQFVPWRRMTPRLMELERQCRPLLEAMLS
jgi:Putative quorum-sensing-regulated virulence factor